MKTLIKSRKITEEISAIITMLLLLMVLPIYSSETPKIDFKNVSVTEAMHIINTFQDVVILDVRDLNEFEFQRLTGSISIPLLELGKNMKTIGINSTLIVYSQNGEESAKACELLSKMGYKSLYNLKKGMNEVLAAKMPITEGNKQNNSRRIPLAIKDSTSQLKKSFNASSYCTSIGGDKAYEYIQSVTYSVISPGVLSINVIIAINNPSGCTYGEPCPSYDDSPEYINAWIDWNGNKVFEDNERVLNVALSGYVGINYYGTMSTSTVVAIPDTIVNSTWMRVNLGWDYDPNDPCDYSWTWGDVFDKPVEISNTPPKIKDIVITGIPEAAHPLTAEPTTAVIEEVKLEATIEEQENYEIIETKWSGEIIGGKGNPYKYSATPGSHGNKNVICTITYRHNSSGIVGTHSLSKKFKLFFTKRGDDDADELPNWFEYWKRDGAVPDMSPAKYDKSESAYGYMTAAGELFLTPHSAGQHYNNPIVIPTNLGTESFGGPTIRGIDCTAEIVAHENYHKWVNEQWVAGGSFAGNTDSDKGVPAADNNDKLPDFYEKATSKTDTSKTDTYDLEHKKAADYRRYGDNELMAMRAGDSKKGDPLKDWALYGKQSNPVWKIDIAEKASYTDPVLANFTGTYSDLGVDNNTDGTYEYLKVIAELNVTSAGIFNLVAIVNDTALEEVSLINKRIDLGLGVQSLIVEFNGLDINQHAVDGPYTITLLLADEYGNELDYQYNIHTTVAYTYTDFKGKDANFLNTFSDYGTDTGVDGLFDSLTIEIGVNILTAGVYTLEGGLYDNDTNVIEIKNYNFNLSAGNNIVALNFDGSLINLQKLNGPYYLRYLTISKDSLSDFIYEAYTTAAYNYTEFQSTLARFSGIFNDFGTDNNNNSLYDIMTIEVGINAISSGQYTLVGSLYDSLGAIVLKADNISNLIYGDNTVNLEFDGITLFENAVDGPYFLNDLSLLDENGNLMDLLNYADTTSNYQYTEFENQAIPLVTLAGTYTENKIDLDSNCVVEYLAIIADINIADSGYVIIKAKLEDVNGAEIVWAENMAFLKTDSTQAILLNFDASTIYNHGVDGPYYLKNVYIYHTGDPSKPDYITDAFTTYSYRFSEFDTIPGFQTNLSETICYNEAYHVGDSVFAVTGYYSVNLTSQNGCDSLVILDLTINPELTIALGNDTTINTAQSLLLDAGAGYQSYNWSNGLTTQTIIIDNSYGVGQHAFSVIVTDLNNCIAYDTIIATIESLTDISEIDEDSGLVKLYPNPTEGILNIEIENRNKKIEIQIFSEIGKMIFSKQYGLQSNDLSEQIDLNNFSSGTYFFKLIHDDKIKIKKFIIEK